MPTDRGSDDAARKDGGIRGRSIKKARTTRRFQPRGQLDASLPLSQERRLLADTMQEHRNGSWRLLEDPETLGSERSLEESDARAIYEGQLDAYFSFPIEYYQFFENKLRFARMRRWTFYIDIHDESVETKFPLDKDIRAYISAFRDTMYGNMLGFMWGKRRNQAAVSLLFFAPALAVALSARLGRDFGSSATEIGGFSLPVWWLAALGGYGALALIGLYLARLYKRQMESDFRTNAANMKTKLQRRMNVLANNFTYAQKKIYDTEFERLEHPEAWPDEAKWWARLVLWLPKRIEYIEKFYQSEMQRLRIFDKLSKAVSFVTVWATAIAAVAVGWGAASLAAEGSLGSAGGLCVLATAAAVLYALLQGQRSLSIDAMHVREWIGQADWRKFYQLHYDEQVADIIRRDKVRIHQEKSRGGGFGTMTAA